jgi:hypothetical protein
MRTLRKQFSGPIPSSVAGVDAVLAELQWSIDGMLKRRDILNRYREWLKPRVVHSLPEDVLVRIFEECIFIPFDWFSESRLSSFGRRFPFMRVCRKWRSLALSTPLLWRDPLLHNPDLTKFMLEHAKDAPLRLFVHWDHYGERLSSDQEAVDLVLEKMPQVTDMVISGPPSLDMLQVIRSSNLKGASRLKSLRVDIREGKHLALPAVHFGPFSSLSTLNLTRCSIPWDTPLFANLTHLDFNGQYSGNTHKLSAVVQTITRMPLLVDLSLQFCIDISSLPREASSFLSMKRLNRLVISDDLRVGTALLRHIAAAPALRSLEIGDGWEADCPQESRHADVIRALFSQIHRLYGTSILKAPLFRRLESDYYDKSCCFLSLIAREFSEGQDDGKGCCLDLHMDVPSYEQVALASDLAVETIPLRGLREVVASSDYIFENIKLRSATELTRIEVKESCARFITSWCLPKHATGFRVTQYPALKSVVFSSCQLGRREGFIGLDIPPPRDTRSELQALAHTVRQLHKDGRPLEYLAFKNCFFEQEDSGSDEYCITDESVIRARLEPWVKVLEFPGGLRDRPIGM